MRWVTPQQGYPQPGPKGGGTRGGVPPPPSSGTPLARSDRGGGGGVTQGGVPPLDLGAVNPPPPHLDLARVPPLGVNRQNDGQTTCQNITFASYYVRGR